MYSTMGKMRDDGGRSATTSIPSLNIQTHAIRREQNLESSHKSTNLSSPTPTFIISTLSKLIGSQSSSQQFQRSTAVFSSVDRLESSQLLAADDSTFCWSLTYTAPRLLSRVAARVLPLQQIHRHKSKGCRQTYMILMWFAESYMVQKLRF